jgi:LysR family glycine cleavage system transcriptional activator
MKETHYHCLPSLNGLKFFEAAARHSSFTRAARELNVTQGAVSRQIKLLENQLNVILFHRAHRKLDLTEQGRILARDLARAFNIMTEAVVRIKHRPQDLNLKVHPTFAIRWLIPQLHKFQALYPDIQVRFTTSSVNVDFSKENFDAGITHLGEEVPGINRTLILKEQLIPVCAPQLLKTEPVVNDPENIKHYMLLHNSPDLKEWAAWADQNGIQNFPLEKSRVFEVDDAALQAATAGLGLALGDLFLIRDELESGRLVTPFGQTPIRTGNYYFSWPEFNQNSKGVNAFKQWLVDNLPSEGV